LEWKFQGEKTEKNRKNKKKNPASSAVFSAQHNVAHWRKAVSRYDVTTSALSGHAGTLTWWQEGVGCRISLIGVDAP